MSLRFGSGIFLLVKRSFCHILIVPDLFSLFWGLRHSLELLFFFYFEGYVFCCVLWTFSFLSFIPWLLGSLIIICQRVSSSYVLQLWYCLACILALHQLNQQLLFLLHLSAFGSNAFESQFCNLNTFEYRKLFFRLFVLFVLFLHSILQLLLL